MFPFTKRRENEKSLFVVLVVVCIYNSMIWIFLQFAQLINFHKTQENRLCIFHKIKNSSVDPKGLEEVWAGERPA